MNDKEQKFFGERIRGLRLKKDLSLREFAGKLGGLSAAFLSDIELGRRFPSEEVLEKMAKALGVSVDYLRSFRPPSSEEMKKLIKTNPSFGIAFRGVVDKKVSPEELINLTKNKPKREKIK